MFRVSRACSWGYFLVSFFFFLIHLLSKKSGKGTIRGTKKRRLVSFVVITMIFIIFPASFFLSFIKKKTFFLPSHLFATPRKIVLFFRHLVLMKITIRKVEEAKKLVETHLLNNKKHAWNEMLNKIWNEMTLNEAWKLLKDFNIFSQKYWNSFKSNH